MGWAVSCVTKGALSLTMTRRLVRQYTASASQLERRDFNKLKTVSGTY